jgi:hypothetical protein
VVERSLLSMASDDGARASGAGAAKSSDISISAQDVIGRVLRLGCGVNHKPAVIASGLYPENSPEMR